MIKSLKRFMQQRKEQYRVPRRVQDLIPINCIWNDGIMRSGKFYSKTYHFSDINYKVASDEDQKQMFLDYSAILNGWTITTPSDDLLEVILKYELSDILINRNEIGGFQITGTGTHNGVPTFVGVAPRKSSSRKYACPCCGMSVRATKVVNIACMDCDEQLLLVG